MQPKLKYYLEAQSAQQAQQLQAAVAAELVRPEQHGLTQPQH